MSLIPFSLRCTQSRSEICGSEYTCSASPRKFQRASFDAFASLWFTARWQINSWSSKFTFQFDPVKLKYLVSSLVSSFNLRILVLFRPICLSSIKNRLLRRQSFSSLVSDVDSSRLMNTAWS